MTSALPSSTVLCLTRRSKSHLSGENISENTHDRPRAGTRRSRRSGSRRAATIPGPGVHDDGISTGDHGWRGDHRRGGHWIPGRRSRNPRAVQGDGDRRLHELIAYTVEESVPAVKSLLQTIPGITIESCDSKGDANAASACQRKAVSDGVVGHQLLRLRRSRPIDLEGRWYSGARPGEGIGRGAGRRRAGLRRAEGEVLVPVGVRLDVGRCAEAAIDKVQGGLTPANVTTALNGLKDVDMQNVGNNFTATEVANPAYKRWSNHYSIAYLIKNGVPTRSGNFFDVAPALATLAPPKG